MPTSTESCEAEQRILRAVFAIEQMTGNWVIDLAKLKQILTGAECHEHTEAT